MVLLETRAQRCPPVGPAHTCPPEPPGQRTGQPRGPFLPREQAAAHNGQRRPISRHQNQERSWRSAGAPGGAGSVTEPAVETATHRGRKRPAGSGGGEAEGFRIAPRVSCAEQASSEFTHGSPDPPQLRCDCV